MLFNAWFLTQTSVAIREDLADGWRVSEQFRNGTSAYERPFCVIKFYTNLLQDNVKNLIVMDQKIDLFHCTDKK